MCQVCKVISDLNAKLDFLPDDLHHRSADFVVDVDKVKQSMENEYNEITRILSMKGLKRNIDCNDTYSLLRRVLPGDQEFTEDDAHLKKVLAHICISHNVFLNLLQYLNILIKDYQKYNKNHKDYYKHYTRIQDTLGAVQDLCNEYDKFIKKIRNGGYDSWFVVLPYPENLIDMIADALRELKNGDLSVPLLRSYFEVKSSIFTENSLNNLIRNSGLEEYKEKKIVFERSMEFSDLINILSKLNILNPRDTDIVLRMHDYTSKSIHIGAFFDKVVAWYLLFYLKNMKLGTATAVTLLADFIKDYQRKNKCNVISEYDKVSDYSRFQPSSNQIK